MHVISVIIPTFNAEADIHACLESLRMQTFQQFEVCLVDAQSTDGTLEKAQAFAGKVGSTMQCCSEPDGGCMTP